jgi:hypothetical protein
MMMMPSPATLKLPIFLIGLLLLALGQLQGVQAVKFKLQAERYPQPKCLWNSAHDNGLVIVTANVGVCFKNYLDPGESGPLENWTANQSVEWKGMQWGRGGGTKKTLKELISGAIVLSLVRVRRL